MARLLAIYVRPASGTPPRRVAAATAIAEQGLEGDHASGGKRQITFLDRAAWEAAASELGAGVDGALDPALRRANLYVEGLDLAATIGSELRVGAVRILVTGEAKPCRLMDEMQPGLRAALEPACRGGVYGRIVAGGELREGDELRGA